jgi:formate hydrogenlyase subunit 3/multisubunit Na+/H+ antiporter MnhD subunit
MGYLINKYVSHSSSLSSHMPLLGISISTNKSEKKDSANNNLSKDLQKTNEAEGHQNQNLTPQLSGGTGLKFKETDLNYLSELKGQLNNNYILSFSLAVCLFSMAGVPPLMGFFGKQFVLYSSIEDGNLFLSFVAILVSVISASYYLKIVNYSFFSTGDTNKNTNIDISTSLSSFSSKAKDFEENEKEEEKSILTVLNINQIHSFIISFLTFTIILFFTQPSILLNCSSYIALTIFNI